MSALSAESCEMAFGPSVAILRRFDARNVASVMFVCHWKLLYGTSNESVGGEKMPFWASGHRVAWARERAVANHLLLRASQLGVNTLSLALLGSQHLL